MNPIDPDVVATVASELLGLSTMFGIPEGKVLQIVAEASLEYDLSISAVTGMLCAVANAGLLKHD